MLFEALGFVDRDLLSGLDWGFVARERFSGSGCADQDFTSPFEVYRDCKPMSVDFGTWVCRPRSSL